jgi:septal ring factor EnvC (AmiA/AmiB activator)
MRAFAGIGALFLWGLLHAAHASPRSAAMARLAEAQAARSAASAAAANAARDLESTRSQATRLAGQRAEAAATLRRVEAGVLEASDRLAAASGAEAQAKSALERREAAFAALLPLMLRLGRYPVETVLAVPGPQERAIEGLLLARGLATQLNREAAALRADRERAANLGQATAREAQALARQRAAQADRAATLDRFVLQARTQLSQAEFAARDAAQAIEATAARAQSLRDAISSMDSAQSQAVAKASREAALADRQRKPAVADAARARQVALARPAGPVLDKAAGRLVRPVAGPVLQAFGAAAEDGPATGLTFATAQGAFVSSPCAGRVAFAAPFRSYGRLLILECGGGYDFVLAGLGRIDVSAGGAVRPGEPVGRMPETPARPKLYVELRSAGQPIDPAPFLNATL